MLKAIPTFGNNLKVRFWLKIITKPCFCLGIFLAVVLALTIQKTSPQTGRSVFANKTCKTESFCSALIQGEERKEYPELFSIQDNSLVAISPYMVVNSQVLGAMAGSQGSGLNKEIEEYIVQDGDTLDGLAKKFEITLETILWANNLTSKSVIKPGQKLIILPATGAMHLVRDGDTVSQIAQTYQAKKEDIIAFNGLPDNGDIFIGDILVIPDGKMPVIRPASQTIPLASSYFIFPLAGAKITQGLHWYNAIDFGTSNCGDPVYAAAGGTIQKISFGSIYGYYIQILHPNGVATLYAHLSKAIVAPEQKVLQGQVIGYTGYTGRTIPAGPAGCHLHFEVRGAINPFAR